MKKIVLRRVSTFYPGIINLPTKKPYQVSDNGNEIIEFIIKRHFTALNIIDYENQLQKGKNNSRIKFDRSYETKKEIFIIEANRNDALVGAMELSGLRKEPYNNLKRALYNSNFTEIIILHYFFDVTVNPQVSSINVPFDNIYYQDLINKIVDYYILSSGDYIIPPPQSHLVPSYLESFDLNFDIDVPKEEIREVILSKTDLYADHINSKFDMDDFISNHNRTTKVNIDSVDSNMIHILKSGPPDGSKIVGILAKAKREITKNKNYKYALLECFTFIEAYISQYLSDSKLKAGVSKSKLEKYAEEVTISYKLNVELPIFLNLTDDDRNIVGGVDLLRKKRNEIIHSSKDDEIVTEQDAINAINAVTALFSLIEGQWSKN